MCAELENIVTRLVALSDGGPIHRDALDEPSVSRRATPSSFRNQVEGLERTLLTDALQVATGNQSEAARSLGPFARHLSG